MRKTVVILAIVFGTQFTYAQKSVYSEFPNKLYNQGKEMYLDFNYVGAINTLQEFKKTSKDDKLLAEADYMIVSSEFYQGNTRAGNYLKDYLEKYPSTYHRNQINFFVGTTHFEAKEWDKALFWYKQVEVDQLTTADQDDYFYRAAYSFLQNGENSVARNMFGVLTRVSTKYKEPASYYLAYIDFQSGNYADAVPTFRRLKSNPEYKENSTFFLMQSAYQQGNLQEAINEGRDYVASYPKSNNTAEVFRLLGSSYYQTGDITNSIINYERFLQFGVQPFREDLYQLGDAYYQRGNYNRTVEVLKGAVSTSDKLGQAANLLLGQACLKTGDTRNALLAFDAAARSNFDRNISEDALYNFVLLTNQANVSAFDQSITAFQRFLNEYPNSKYSDKVNSLFATTLLSTKSYGQALSIINNIKSPSRQILDAKQMIYLQLGTQDFVNGAYGEAYNSFTSCINMGSYNTTALNEAYFWRAETSYRQENYSAAIKDYTTYVSQSSAKDNYALALYNLGYAYYKTKRMNEALANYKKYVSAETNRKSPNYADALNRIGDCYLYSRNFSEAERYYSQAVNQEPANADYSEFQKAFVLGLQRNYAGKVSALNDMMKKYPNSEYVDDALYEKSRALVMQDKEREAIIVLEQLLREYPSSNLNAQAGTQLGQLYFNTNNAQKSIEAYKRVINNYPNSEEARISIKSLESVYKDMNDVGGYASYVNSLGGGYSLSVSRQDSLTYLAAEGIYMKGQKTQASASLNKYLQSYPNGLFASDAHYNLGVIALEAKDSNSARQHFNYVINSNSPKYIANALIALSGIEFDNKEYQAAYDAYKKLETVASDAEDRNIAQLGMLRCSYLSNRDAEVVDASNKILANSKVSADVANEARFYRAKSQINLNKPDAAITDLDMLAKDTRSVFGAEAQYLLADIYYKKGAYDKAEAQVTGFMKQGTTHQYWMARAVIVLADVYITKGDKFQARQYLESLQANYAGGEADVKEMISKRLSALD